MIIAWKIVSGCCKPMQGAGPCGSVFTAKNFWDPDLAFRRTLLVQNENAFFNSVFWDCIFHMHIGSCHNPRWGVKTNWDRIRLGSKPQHWQGVINISNFFCIKSGLNYCTTSELHLVKLLQSVDHTKKYLFLPSVAYPLPECCNYFG